jgi:small subunit ribosomal protein S2
MNQYIYGERNGIHIINLDHTLTALKRALSVTKEVALEGGHILFVGSRPALHSVVVQAALEGNAYYVHQWKGGLITNKERVLRRSVGFDPDKVVQESRVLLTATDSEAELEAALNSAKGGAKTQPYVHSPDLIILLDTPNNSWAIHEANFAGIPVIAVCDTDCDPAKVQYPIPANDDSLLGLKLIAGVLSRAAKEGSERRAILQAELKKTGGEGNNNNKDKKKNRRH